MIFLFYYVKDLDGLDADLLALVEHEEENLLEGFLVVDEFDQFGLFEHLAVESGDFFSDLRRYVEDSLLKEVLDDQFVKIVLKDQRGVFVKKKVFDQWNGKTGDCNSELSDPEFA